MKIFRFMHRLNRFLVALLQVLLVVVFAVLVVDVIWAVLSRYLWGSQASWSEELARLMMVWLAFLGAALACREERHLGLDVIVRFWPQEVQRLGQLVVHGMIFFFAAGVMTWGGLELVKQRFASGQTLPALGIAKAWFYLALPISGALITLFTVEAFWRMLNCGERNAEEVET